MFEELVDSLVGLSDADLRSRIEQNELDRRRLDAEMSAALAVADARNLAGSDGHRSMTAFCRARLNWSTAEATRRLGLARSVDSVADLGSLWYDGRFGLAQATKMSQAYGNRRVRDLLPDHAPLLLEHAELMPYSDFAIAVDHFVVQADEDGAHQDRDELIEGRRARVVDVGGSLDIRGSGGDGLTTAEMLAIHHRFTEVEYQRDLAARRVEHGDAAEGFALARTDRQRRFDALCNIFRAAASADLVDGRAPASMPLVNIVIDADTWGRMLLDAQLSTNRDLDGNVVDPFTGLAVDDSESIIDNAATFIERRCESSNGVSLHPHDVLRAALAGHVRRVVVDSGSVVIDQGRRQRLFTGNARRAAKLLIRRCEYAGCELPGDWCDVDHSDEWHRDGGRTDQVNSRVVCDPHNVEKHRKRWRIRRGVNGCGYTIREDGTIILPIGARPPAFPTDDGVDGDDDGVDDGDGDGDDDSPAEIARLTVVTRNRLAPKTRRAS